MSMGRPSLTEVFASIDRLRESLKEKHEPEVVRYRLRLVKDMAARLPLKYLPAATNEQIKATERFLIKEGRSRSEVKLLRTTLEEMFDQFVFDKALRRHPLRGEDRVTPNPVSLPEAGIAVEMPAALVEAIATILQPVGSSLHAEASTDAALERAGWFPFSFVVCAFPIDGPARFFDTLRGPATLCRGAGVILVVSDAQVPDAELYLGRGANRVISVSRLVDEIGSVVAELTQVAERVRFRIPVSVEFNRSKKSEEWRCENISGTGMLLKTVSRRGVGDLLDIQFALPGAPRKIRAIAEIVRSTTFGREDLEGYGIHFLSFSGDSQFHLENFLK